MKKRVIFTMLMLCGLSTAVIAADAVKNNVVTQQQVKGTNFSPIASGSLAAINTSNGDVGFLAEYFAGSDFKGSPVNSRFEGMVGVDMIGKEAVSGTGSNGYSVRWTASVTPSRSGRYPIAFAQVVQHDC